MVFCNSNDAKKLLDRISYIYIDDVNARISRILSLLKQHRERPENSGKGQSYRPKQKFGLIKRVDKGLIITVKDLQS